MFAQTNQSTTNVALIANIALIGYSQAEGSTATPVRITSKDLIVALNASGAFHFGSNARLIFLSAEDQLPTVWVREGSGANETSTSISDFFTISQPAEIDGNHNLTCYSIRIFSFDDGAGTTFTTSGMATLRRGRIISRTIGPLMRVTHAQTQVSGEGTVRSAKAVLRGTINAGSPKAEVGQD